MRRISARFRITALAALAAGMTLPAAAQAADLRAADYKLSGPYTHGNLTLYMIHGKPGDTGKPPLTLQEALQRGVVRVRETGNVDRLEIENLGDQDIFVQAGDIVKGGQQDRVVQLDLVLAPRSGRIPLAAFCVEAGRWAARGTEDVKQFSSATTSLPSRDLKLAARGVPAKPDARPPEPEPRDPHQRRQSARTPPADSQGRVWAGVAEMQRKLSDTVKAPVAAPASASSLQLSLENQKLQATIKETVATLTPAIDKEPDVVGYVFAINGKINSAEVYGSGGLFRKMWPKLLHASAVEALSERKGADAATTPPTVDAVRAFLVEGEAGKPTERKLPADMTLKTVDADKAVVFESRKAGAASPVVRRSYVAK